MGLEIYSYLERLDGKKWVCLNKFVRNPYYRPDEISCINQREFVHEEFDIGANRNFLSIASHDHDLGELDHVPYPRGLPQDLSRSLRETYGSHNNSGIHSMSWILWYEVLLYIAFSNNAHKAPVTLKSNRDEFGIGLARDMIEMYENADPREFRLVLWCAW